VTKDHYAVLGVAPAAEQVVIRAAYRALMRRYHPDADASAEAAEQARAINAAYAVLGDPEKRSRYDRSFKSSRPLRFEPSAAEQAGERKKSRLGPALAVGVALVAAGMVAVAVMPPLESVRIPKLKLDGGSRQVTRSEAISDGPARREAARAGTVVLPPVEPDTQPRERKGVDPTLSDQAKSTNAPDAVPRVYAKADSPVVDSVASPKTAPVQPPSTDSGCSLVPRRTDRMICGDKNLASLDRQLTLLYRQSWGEADEGKRAALLQTRKRFNDRREACSSSNCLTTAYVVRMKEISDIMAGRAQP
jgi:curved DNA-binding protein CbpA